MANNRRLAPLGIAVRAVVGVVALALAVGLFALLQATRPEAPRRPRVEQGRVVRVVTVAPVRVERGWEGYGTARALRSADIPAQISERVIERPAVVEEGGRVERGDLIVALERRPFEDRVTQARERVSQIGASLEAIEVEEPTWRRALELAQDALRISRDEVQSLRDAVAEGGGSSIEVDRLERELTVREREVNELARQVALIGPRRGELVAQQRAARAQLETAERDLTLTRIEAPISGVLQSVGVEIGEWVSVGAPVARVVDLSRIEIPVRLPLSASSSIRTGDRAEVRAGGAGEGSWEGIVSRIAPEADADRRSVTVYVEVEQDVPTGRLPGLVPGEFVRATVFNGRGADRLVVPRTAVNGDRVMVVNAQGVAETRRVSIAYYTEGAFAEIHPREREWAVLEGGLASGDRVIISNLDEIHDGELIDATNAVESAGVDRYEEDPDEQGVSGGGSA